MSSGENQNYHPHPHYRAPMYEICSGLQKAVLHVPPQKICHTGAVIVGVGGEFLVVKQAKLVFWPMAFIGCTTPWAPPAGTIRPLRVVQKESLSPAVLGGDKFDSKQMIRQ